MNNPTARIGRGLDAHERAKNSPGTFKLAALAAAPSTIAEISNITVKAARARDRLHVMKAASIDAVQKHRDKITAEYADLGMVEHESGRGRFDTLGADRRHKMIEGSVKKFRKELNAETAEERTRLLAEQGEAKTTLDLVRRAWTRPVDSLLRSTLGSERRATYTRNLERAGQTELENAIQESVTTDNRELAAACLTRLDSIGKEGRKSVRFSKIDVAEVLAGADFLKAQEAFGLADLAIAQSELAEREIQGKPLSPSDKMRIGLMRHDLESKIGRKIDTDGHVIDADGNPTGETFEERLDRLYPGGPLPEGFTFVETDGSEVNAD